MNTKDYKKAVAKTRENIQKRCIFCHKQVDNLEQENFICNSDHADAAIDLDDNEIYFDNSDGQRTFGRFRIHFCPICGRKLEA